MQLCETSKSELETTKTTAEKSFSSVVKSNTKRNYHQNLK
jgi:hypothetical protein